MCIELFFFLSVMRPDSHTVTRKENMGNNDLVNIIEMWTPHVSSPSETFFLLSTPDTVGSQKARSTLTSKHCHRELSSTPDDG